MGRPTAGRPVWEGADRDPFDRAVIAREKHGFDGQGDLATLWESRFRVVAGVSEFHRPDRLTTLFEGIVT